MRKYGNPEKFNERQRAQGRRRDLELSNTRDLLTLLLEEMGLTRPRASRRDAIERRS